MVPLGWGCSSSKTPPTSSASSQGIRSYFTQQVTGDMPRDTRPPFDIPAISYSTPHQSKQAPGAARETHQLAQQHTGAEVSIPCCDRSLQLAEAIWPAHDVAVLVACLQVRKKAVVSPIRFVRQPKVMRRDLPPKSSAKHPRRFASRRENNKQQPHQTHSHAHTLAHAHEHVHVGVSEHTCAYTAVTSVACRRTTRLLHPTAGWRKPIPT